MDINYQGKTVLITGATRGIGKQIANDFSELGAPLILTGTDAGEIRKLNEAFAGKEVKYYCVDFSDATSLEAFTGELKKYDRIDVCVNNAGINIVSSVYDIETADWEHIMDVNLKAPMVICREVGRLMKDNGYGRIVNIASIFGVISRVKRAAYSSSKSGLLGLTRAVALDLAPYNVLVNCVSPGFVLTDLTRDILSEAEMKKVEAEIPLGRLAAPEDISRVVLFLASDLNTYITAQNIVVDGGYVSS